MLNEPLRLLKEILVQPNQIQQIKFLRRACKMISTMLLQDKHEQSITFDTQLFKYLFISSVLCERSVIYLLKAMIEKGSDRSYFLCYVWNAVEFIASLEQGGDKKELPFITNNAVAIKENTLKLMPMLISLTTDRPGINLIEKMQVFKIISKNTKNQNIMIQASAIYNFQREKINMKNRDCSPIHQDSRQITKKNNSLFSEHQISQTSIECEFKIESIQKWLAVKGRTFQDYSDQYHFSKEETIRLLYSYIIFPDQIQPDRECWSSFTRENGIPNQLHSNIRSQQTCQLLECENNLRVLSNVNPDYCNIFFIMLEELFKKIDKRTIIINHIVSVLQSLLVFKPYVFLTGLYRHKILKGLILYLGNRYVSEFFLNLLSPLTRFNFPEPFQAELLEMMETFEFTQMLVANLCEKDFSYLKKKESIKHRDMKISEFQSTEIVQKMIPIEYRKSLIAIHPHATSVKEINTYQQDHPRFQTIIPTILQKPKISTCPERISISQDHVLPHFICLVKDESSNWVKKVFKLVHDSPPAEPRAYGFSRQKIKSLYPLHKDVMHTIIKQANKLKQVQPWCLIIIGFVQMLLVDCLSVDHQSDESNTKYASMIIRKLCDADLLPFLYKNYLSKLMVSAFERADNMVKPSIGNELHRILTFLLEQSTKSDILEEYLPKLKEYFEDNINQLQNVVVLLNCLPRKEIYIGKDLISFEIGNQSLGLIRLLRLLLLSFKEQAIVMAERMPESIWHLLTIWFFDCKLCSMYSQEYVGLLKLILPQASEQFITLLLFKIGLLTSLREAYEDIVRNSVLMEKWNIEECYHSLVQIFKLIQKVSKLRMEYANFRENLFRFHSWDSLCLSKMGKK